MYADAKARQAADAAIAACRPHIPADAICYICRDDASREGLVSQCGCHGGDGIAHVSCLVRQALMSAKDMEETGCGEGMRKWDTCFVCRTHYHGALELALARAMWRAYAGLPESDQRRCQAMGNLGGTLRCVDANAALPVLKAVVATIQRYWPHNGSVLYSSIMNLSMCYCELEQFDEALRLDRAVYADTLVRCGPDHVETISTGCCLTNSLRRTNHFSEARKVAEEMASRVPRLVGGQTGGLPAGQYGGINSLGCLKNQVNVNLAAALVGDPAASRDDVVEAKRLYEGSVTYTRQTYGPQHPITLSSISVLEVARERLGTFDS